MSRRSSRRIAGVAAASWVLATAVTSFVVWRAVAVFNDGTSTNILSVPQVSERLEAATAIPAAATSATTSQTVTLTTATPSTDDPSETTAPSSPTTSAATRTTSRSSGPVTTAPPQSSATPVVKTWTVTGGTVSVSCQAQAISLIYASPQDGWRVEAEKHSTDRIDINFDRIGQGTEMRAACVSGVPQQTTQPSDGDH